MGTVNTSDHHSATVITVHFNLHHAFYVLKKKKSAATQRSATRPAKDLKWQFTQML